MICRPFIPKAARIDQEKDPRLATLAALLAQCASVHGAGTYIAESLGGFGLYIYRGEVDSQKPGYNPFHLPLNRLERRLFGLYLV